MTVPVRAAAVAGLAIALACGSALARGAESPARLDSIATAFRARGFAGAILVTRGADTLLDQGYGDADRERHVPDTPATRFRIGSLTKTFTAAAVMRLAERGKLATSDPVRRWIPEVDSAWSGVTLRHLLSHTGGIPDRQDDSDFVRGGRIGSPGLLAARRYAHQPLDFAPGTKFAYSNTGYHLLGAVIEAASGRSYESFVTEDLLRPLGLRDTGFSPDSTRDAIGYWNRSEVVRARVTELDMSYAAGELISTTHDLARWERTLLTGQLLGAEPQREMTTPVLGDYAYGIHHRTGPGREVDYHTGRIDGFESVMGWYPADSVAIVVLANETGGWRINELYDALAAASHSPVASR